MTSKIFKQLDDAIESKEKKESEEGKQKLQPEEKKAMMNRKQRRKTVRKIYAHSGKPGRIKI